MPSSRTSPPPLPGTPPPEQREQPQAHWIGFVIAAIAIIILLLMFFLPKSHTSVTQGSQGKGVSTSDRDGEDSSTGDDIDSAISAPGESEQASNPGQAAEGEDETDSALTDSNQSELSDAVEAEPESDSQASASTSEPSLTPDVADPNEATAPSEPARPQRTRNLNVGDGFVPLAVGQGNPLRVGNEAKTIVYVIDKSSSMAGGSFGQVVIALLDAVDALTDEQRYAVVLFDTGSYPLGSLHLKKASNTQKRNTRSLLQQVTPDGGTEPFNAVRDALSLDPEAIVFLSDGGFDQFGVIQITQLNHSRSPVTTIHCVGLQHNIPTLRQLAAQNGNGAYTTANLLQSP